MVLQIGSQDGPRPKCYFTHSRMPTYVNLQQPPMRKSPFSTVAEQAVSHTVSVILAETDVKAFQSALGDGREDTLTYARVHMKLSEIIEGGFFNHYIKSGNVLMFSGGRPGVDHTFSLRDGVLHLEVDKPTFERLGLEGHAIPSGGRKHVKARYAIDINLRLPSMVHGKKGFERVVRAFNNVLNHSVTWLFYDLKGMNDGSGPISDFQPTLRNVSPVLAEMHGVSIPTFARNGLSMNEGGASQVDEDHDGEDEYSDDEDDVKELLEWLTLALHLSPRLESSDDMDTYLCRSLKVRDENANIQDLTSLTWHGLIPATFSLKLLMAATRATNATWFALSGASFTGENYIVLRTGTQTMNWQFKD